MWVIEGDVWCVMWVMEGVCDGGCDVVWCEWCECGWDVDECGEEGVEGGGKGDEKVIGFECVWCDCVWDGGDVGEGVWWGEGGVWECGSDMCDDDGVGGGEGEGGRRGGEGEGEDEGEGERGGDVGRVGCDVFIEIGEWRICDGEIKGKFVVGGEELCDKFSGGDGGLFGGDGWEVANAIFVRVERVFVYWICEGDVFWFWSGEKMRWWDDFEVWWYEFCGGEVRVYW